MAMDKFVLRHNGPREHEIDDMLKIIGASSLDELINQTIPANIRLKEPLKLDAPLSEYEFLNKMKVIASKNKIFRTFIGMGYYRTAVPSVILRNVFENPAWYTSYTPYQAEISQGRLEALINFQTMVMSLTGMEIANCSLLDESTAAAEAMKMMFDLRSRTAVKEGKNIVFVDENIFPQTKDVIITRAAPLGIVVETGDFSKYELHDKVFGVVVQYLAANGEIRDYSEFCKKAHEKEIRVTVAADILALALLKAPAQWGADIAVGSTQRFGIPMGFGGPSAGYLATKDEYKRNMPGRIIGVSVDRLGRKSLRMALQTREQHIKREKASSNICTAQALLATMAGMYAVYHGPEGIKRIALHAHHCAVKVAAELEKLGYKLTSKNFFDTIEITGVNADEIRKAAEAKEINFFYPDAQTVRMSFDEVTSCDEVRDVVSIFAEGKNVEITCGKNAEKTQFNTKFKRDTPFLDEKIFNRHRSETDMMRYIKKLERRDISLTHSMISLGSCTMKLNAATEMLPLSWGELGNIHPFAPTDQAMGYLELIDDLGKDLAVITGFDSTSFQPNSGASGEYTGLMVIRQYHISRGEGHRNVAIIPASAHGTNPASASMAGMQIVIVTSDENGNINIDDLRVKTEAHKDNLSCIMITYPSTHGVFESRVREIMDIIHENGGQVYMDGANMNAQVALTNPGFIGADVCHLNLHKTFAIPHGGGGPGEGPICVAKHLSPFLPSHPLVKTGGKKGIHAVAASPFGSAMILPITYGYIKMLGEEGLRKVTELAILNANYLSKKLSLYYNTLYTGETGRVGHECIIDLRDFRKEYGVDATDIAKRLMDYGFHAPTLSFPVAETLMVEPTESEIVQELDRFIETMISIKQECEDIKSGKLDKEDNPVKMAPHVVDEVAADEWNHKYSRKQAVYPLEWIAENKFWPTSARVDNGYGDRNLVCSCTPLEEYM
ncbi:MAG: aminomethyl-transferring glycine dehydrogenase [Prevotellaceae bacterium]|jgi:glycine dehydrogenase|nr:aminomethyl-transferring glycine dehydrogenase [Prevotellaceae bacterium]